ncbi:MAG: squalene/phytoene synthase family protein [Nitrococcus mobilis]|nr:squalene/phytoene synthase family protein [Nitrococcus mobilis]
MQASDQQHPRDGGSAVAQQQLLPGVSRTFALTIPQLPEPLRTSVTNAYLLCRIADTIEDEPALSARQKQTFHDRFHAIVAGDDESPNRFAADLYPLLSETTLADERELIRQLPGVIAITHSLPMGERAALERCVRIMCEGMPWFQRNRRQGGLDDISEFERYCYYVAGVVGEMLTDLFCQYSIDIARQRERLYALSVSFGAGLQMTNILKDVWEDRRRGACWLPRDVFQQFGFELRDLSEAHYDPAFGAGIRELVARAHGHLRNALTYVQLLPPGEIGIRRFCLWALAMAALTLQRLNANPAYRSGSEVKISRRTVRTTVLSFGLAAGRDTMLRCLFDWAARGLPLRSVDCTRVEHRQVRV